MAATSPQPEFKKRKERARGIEGWRSSQCEGGDQMAGQLWDVGLMPFHSALFWPTHQSITITMAEKDEEQWCRKSTSDNYNARDKIMGTRCTLPIISCISLWLTHPHIPIPPLTTGNHGSYLWNPKWINLTTAVGVAIRLCVCPGLSVCIVLSNVREYLPLTSPLPCKTGTAWRDYCRMKEGRRKLGSVSGSLRMGVRERVKHQFKNIWLITL